MRTRTAYILCLGSFIFGCTITLNLLILDGRAFRTEKSRSTSTFVPDTEQHLLIILIMSSPKNVLRRETIRKTWISLLDQKHKYYFVIGTKDLDSNTIDLVTHENDSYNDLLFLYDIFDSYGKLTEKVLESFKSISTSNFQFVFKLDDDSYVDIVRFETELTSMSQMSSLYWGFFRGDAKVKTEGKWKEMSWNICDTYLPYALGGGYVLSKDLVMFLTSNSAHLRKFRSEDVTIGASLAMVETYRKHDPRFNTEHLSRGCSNSYLVIHKQTTKDMNELHRNLQIHGKLCVVEKIIRPSFIYNWDVLPSKCCIRNNETI
ncbi:hypothetical protein B566_EDAN010079 [Ephemera danica]|nr:hypothetical protein B566_EDAN010079 [Ephemera danica]